MHAYILNTQHNHSNGRGRFCIRAVMSTVLPASILYSR